MLILGDMRDVVPRLGPAAVHACVTDPPYELGFMGRRWDRAGVAFDIEAWRRVLVALQPGGYLLAFGHPRRYHRVACAIEDAGFEICDQILWLRGCGHPKTEGRLKPAQEPIVVARAPGGSTPALRTDACRIPRRPGDRTEYRLKGRRRTQGAAYRDLPEQIDYDGTRGRVPSNVIMSHAARCRLVGTRLVAGDARAGQDKGVRPGGFLDVGADKGDGRPGGDLYGDEVVDVWMCAIECPIGQLELQAPGSSRYFQTFAYEGRATTAERGADNDHETVKPVGVMRWLVRLVAAPGQLVLDPFIGSGTTAIAAEDEGCRWVGVDIDARSFDLAGRRRDARAAAATQLDLLRS